MALDAVTFNAPEVAVFENVTFAAINEVVVAEKNDATLIAPPGAATEIVPLVVPLYIGLLIFTVVALEILTEPPPVGK
jgi:hypothetical protein